MNSVKDAFEEIRRLRYDNRVIVMIGSTAVRGSSKKVSTFWKSRSFPWAFWKRCGRSWTGRR